MKSIFLSTFVLSVICSLFISLVRTNALEQCRSFSDPNIITFDETYYQFHLEGDHFILFDDLKDTRVTVGYEKSGYKSTRNCAVYVKKGRRLIFVDFCEPSSPLLAASKFYGVWVQKNQVGLKSIRDPPSCPVITISDENSREAWDSIPRYISNFKCARLQGSNYYSTYIIRTYERRFEDTVKVRVQMADRHIVDVRVEAPDSSFNNTGGLCGKWDNDSNRELFILDQDGVEHYIDHNASENVQLIGDFWKLHSRYNKDVEKTIKKRCPECYVMAERSFYCPCDDFDLFDITNYNIQKPNRTTYCKIPMGLCLQKLLEANNTCFAPPTTTPSEWWTDEYETTGETLEGETTGETSEGETTGETPEGETTEEETTTPKPIITISQASEICTSAILQNPVISEFIKLDAVDAEFLIDVCINDVVNSQDENAVRSHVAFIKDEIIIFLLKNETLAEIDQELLAGLCPNECSGNGKCVFYTECLTTLSEDCLSPLRCECNKPYGGKDCSRDLSEIAELTLDKSCCDLRNEKCDTITGTGCTYDNDDIIYVKIEFIQEGQDSTSIIEKYTTAEKVNYGELKIKIQGLDELVLWANINNIQTDFVLLESTTIVNVYISYLNDSFTEYTSFILYDSLCRECLSNGTSLLPDTCEIDGICRSEGETLETDVNFICDPLNPTNWTFRPTPDPLCSGDYSWTEWFNLDDPNGDGDLELYGLFGHKYGCKDPKLTFIHTVDNVPFNETGQTLHVDDCFGFMCLNKENNGSCLDYQIKRCCPIVENPRTIRTSNAAKKENIQGEAKTEQKAHPSNPFNTCLELWLLGFRENGYYTIFPDGHNPIEVYCDMKEGGWTVVLNRVPREDEQNHKGHFFDRNYDDYKKGFGKARENFWLGLQALRSIVERSSNVKLRVKAGNSEHGDENDHNHQHYALYSRFMIADEANAYELALGEKYDGDLFDVSQFMTGRVFSASDRDLTDEDCPHKNEAGWWFDSEVCSASGMCLTCKHRDYFSGRGEASEESSYNNYSHIQMAIKAFKSD